MYKLASKQKKYGKVSQNFDFVNLDGFVMASKNKYFLIDGERVADIKVVDDNLISNIVTNQVRRKYKKLIQELTELFICDDENGEGSMNEVLNRTQKFRHEIQYKYKSYLKKQELTKMAKQLEVLDKEAKIKLQEVTSYTISNVIGRGR